MLILDIKEAAQMREIEERASGFAQSAYPLGTVAVQCLDSAILGCLLFESRFVRASLSKKAASCRRSGGDSALFFAF
jgi:hypothetical protein